MSSPRIHASVQPALIGGPGFAREPSTLFPWGSTGRQTGETPPCRPALPDRRLAAVALIRARQAHLRARCRKIQMYPAIRIAKNTSISMRPNKPSTSYWIAHGSRKIVSTSKMTKRIATK